MKLPAPPPPPFYQVLNMKHNMISADGDEWWVRLDVIGRLLMTDLKIGKLFIFYNVFVYK